MPGQAVAPEQYTELVSRRLYRLGGLAPIGDDGISWVAKGVEGYEPISCYLLRDDNGALLVDTGVPLHKAAVAAQLGELVGSDEPVQIFLTRFEADCVGNMPTLVSQFRISAVSGAGNVNPFDFIDDLSSEEQLRHDYEIEKLRVPAGGTIQVSKDRTLELIVTPLRLLATSWAYDSVTSTLFTSDAFGHVQVSDALRSPVVNSSNDTCTIEQVRNHLFTKFEWLRGAETEALVEEISRVFRSRDIEILAPTTGCVIQGRDVVARHVGMVTRVLAEIKN